MYSHVLCFSKGICQHPADESDPSLQRIYPLVNRGKYSLYIINYLFILYARTDFVQIIFLLLSHLSSSTFFNLYSCNVIKFLF